MAVGVPSHRSFRFGEFLLDARSGELRKNGFVVRLQPQPLALLLELLATPGEVVTRDELRARLWPAGTVIDFAAGLNSTVRRLRGALDESAGKSRYVESV